MKRCLPRASVLVAVVLAACGGGSSLPVPEPRPESVVFRENVERLLEVAGAEGILAPRGRAFTRQVAIQIGDPTDPELQRLVAAALDAFAYERLLSDVTDFMVEEGTPELARAALEWMEGGATAAVRRIGEEYQPSQTLEEYASEMTDEPPSEARIHLVSAWAEARGEGTFFVLIQEALREASFRVHAAMRPGAPRFAPLSGEELEVAQVNSHGATVIRLMHGYAPAPDQLIRRATAEYETESGRWFRDTYALAVARAIRSAGERAAAALTAGVGG